MGVLYCGARYPSSLSYKKKMDDVPPKNHSMDDTEAIDFSQALPTVPTRNNLRRTDNFQRCPHHLSVAGEDRRWPRESEFGW